MVYEFKSDRKESRDLMEIEAMAVTVVELNYEQDESLEHQSATATLELKRPAFDSAAPIPITEMTINSFVEGHLVVDATGDGFELSTEISGLFRLFEGDYEDLNRGPESVVEDILAILMDKFKFYYATFSQEATGIIIFPEVDVQIAP